MLTNATVLVLVALRLALHAATTLDHTNVCALKVTLGTRLSVKVNV